MISTQFIFMMAIIVFLLMAIGLVLTMWEFTRMQQEAREEEADMANSPQVVPINEHDIRRH